MTNALRSLTVLAFALLLFSCSKREANLYQVTAAFPGGTIRTDSVLVTTFSRGIVGPESANVWMGTPFIEFTPPIAGKFIWQDSAVLVFSPDAPLPGDAKIRGKLNAALIEKYSGGKRFSGSDEFTFSTESFRLQSAEFFYDRLADRRTVGVKANLEFTYAVNPADAVKYLSVDVDGVRRTGATSPSTRSSRVIPVELGTVPEPEKEKILKVSFDPQLTSTETNTHIAMNEPFEFRLPGIGDLKIYGHEFGFDGSSGWITIRTSQEVDSASIRPFLTIDPDRPFTIQGDRQSFTLRGRFDPGMRLHLMIRKGLESLLGAKLQNDYEADVVIGNIKPSFGFASARFSRTIWSSSSRKEGIMITGAETMRREMISFRLCGSTGMLSVILGVCCRTTQFRYGTSRIRR